jgi:hypothetical protein
MTPEQQEGYRSLIETRGPLGGRRKIWVHNPSWITRAECDRIVDTFGRALATLDSTDQDGVAATNAKGSARSSCRLRL